MSALHDAQVPAFCGGQPATANCDLRRQKLHCAVVAIDGFGPSSLRHFVPAPLRHFVTSSLVRYIAASTCSLIGPHSSVIRGIRLAGMDIPSGDSTSSTRTRSGLA